MNIEEMKIKFSLTGAPIIHSGKKKDMKIEFKLLNDIVAKYQTAKSKSFDGFTTKHFDLMVEISSGIMVK